MRSPFLSVLFLVFGFLAASGCDKPAAGPEAAAMSASADSSAPAEAGTPIQVERAAIGGIPNLTRAGAAHFSGQPGPTDFEALKAAGFERVVNMRQPAEMGGFDEKSAVEALGMTYTAIPWNGPTELTDAVFNQAREVLGAGDSPTLLHCASGNRTGAVWIPFRVLDQGVDIEQAVAEARMMGMRTPDYESIARDYVARNR